MTALVVGGDGNVDELGGGVGVAESDDGDVDVRGLLDGLGIGAGVGDDDQAGLLEGAGDVVGEVTGGEAASNGDGTGVGGELQDSTLAVGTSGDDANVGWVVNGDDDAGSEDDFLPAARVRNTDFLVACCNGKFRAFRKAANVLAIPDSRKCRETGSQKHRH